MMGRRLPGTRARVALVTWMIVYPVITLLLVLLDELDTGWPLPLRTLVASAIMVPTMVFWIMPVVNGRLSRFLKPADASGRSAGLG